jgi:hypothetical protein
MGCLDLARYTGIALHSGTLNVMTVEPEVEPVDSSSLEN